MPPCARQATARCTTSRRSSACARSIRSGSVGKSVIDSRWSSEREPGPTTGPLADLVSSPANQLYGLRLDPVNPSEPLRSAPLPEPASEQERQPLELADRRVDPPHLLGILHG